MDRRSRGHCEPARVDVLLVGCEIATEAVHDLAVHQEGGEGLLTHAALLPSFPDPKQATGAGEEVLSCDFGGSDGEGRGLRVDLSGLVGGELESVGQRGRDLEGLQGPRFELRPPVDDLGPERDAVAAGQDEGFPLGQEEAPPALALGVHVPRSKSGFGFPQLLEHFQDVPANVGVTLAGPLRDVPGVHTLR